MAKYDDMKENIGEIMVAELYATIQNDNITQDELFKV
jgi:hypothetical protein